MGSGRPEELGLSKTDALEMLNQINYVVVDSRSLDELINLVNSMIKSGQAWRPTGGICAHDAMFYQAMVRGI